MRNQIRKNNHSTGMRRAPINPRFNNGRFQPMTGRQAFALLAALLIVVSSLFVRVQAADGDLDLTFDAGGKTTTNFLGGFDAGSSVAIQSDGKIVVAGYVADIYYEQ
ncbi:MAG TPA: hypothetical protein VLD57_03985, partial [Blastocatellia bacterium]|nr:hypothetical protein [Blastocatellia bacterium]